MHHHYIFIPRCSHVTFVKFNLLFSRCAVLIGVQETLWGNITGSMMRTLLAWGLLPTKILSVAMTMGTNTYTYINVIYTVLYLQLADMCSGLRSSSNGAYNVTYAVSGDNIIFTLQAMTTGWVGIGFSLDQFMVSHLYTSECHLSSSIPLPSSSSPPSPPPTPPSVV